MKLTSILSICSIAGFAVASKCKAPPCGRVENNTRWRAKWGDFDPSGTDLCHIYNWNGGDGSIGWKEKKMVPCKQTYVSAHASVGGYTHDKIDVDGITFDDRRWRIVWEKGQSYDFAAGVWAKIGSGETIVCSENVQVPECHVKCSSDLGPLDACIGA
ncbi:hypothetical protein BT63DRAFT_428659 [Microthyrium microscopicum]|uniref:Uncharacterized protein n=1 Tax=Microthyrium microscopicum TaxID=703497 RepID=A0A6A6U250_9PEZI|nr:hypothetical protein BT63DRAFT_428659 [Microthyrium microscopicum]